MDQEHPYELPTMDQSTNNNYSTGTSKPENKQKASMMCLLITIIICTVVLLLANIAGIVAVTLTVGKQQPGASVLPSSSRLEDLESQMISTKSELASTRTQLESQLDSVKTKLDSITSELASTKAELASTTTTLDSELASTKTELATRTQAIDVQVASLETQVNGSIRVNRGVFTAGLSNDLTGLGGGQIVVFDKVLYNPGQDYDQHTGQFTCPLDGLYILHTTVVTDASPSGNHLGVDIVKDGDVIGSTYEEGRFHSGSVTVFTQCNKQQRVWVRIYTAYTGRSIDGGESFFSGAFLRPVN